VVAAYEAGRMHEIVVAAHPEAPEALRSLMPDQAHALSQALAVRVVLGLFEGALLEQGAIVDDSLGDRSRVLRFGGETVRPAAICADAMENDVARRELSRWAALLAAQSAPAAAVA
jgi:hypothetical protein